MKFQITDPEIQNKFIFMQIDINIDSLQIVFYLVLQYKKIQMLYFIQQTD